MSQVDLLYRLQHIDDEIRLKKKRLGEVIRLQRADEQLQTARQQAAEAAAAQQKWHTCHTDLTLELRGLTDKARHSEERLYSGKVKNTKELADLQQEIDSLARRRAALEDEMLETMINLEEAEAQKTAANEALSVVEVAWKQKTAALQQEQTELARAANELNEQRQRHIRLVTAESLAEYEDTSRRRGGIAVVGLKNNVCQGCQVTVSTSKVKLANEGQLVTCGSCNRIIKPL